MVIESGGQDCVVNIDIWGRLEATEMFQLREGLGGCVFTR